MYFPKLSSQFKKEIAALEGKKIAVLGHTRPDGDCIGSQVALTLFLKSRGLEVLAINQDRTPRNLIPFTDDLEMVRADKFKEDDYLAITVDCADPKLLGKTLEKKFPKIELNIDHHLSNSKYAQVNLIDSAASATAEVLAGVFLDNNYAISPAMAQALYVGIATDTGQFRYPSTTIKTFSICSELIRLGAHPAQAAFYLYENQRFESLKLLQLFLETLELQFDQRVCIGRLTDAMYHATQTSREDAEGFVEYARCISGVQIAILLEDTDGRIKGSLRCKDPKYRVDQLAQAFGGGGHTCAAGLRVLEKMETFYPKLIHALEEHLNTVG